MKFTDEMMELSEEGAGYCIQCDNITNESGVEPDAENCPCDECGNKTVMGIENACIMRYII